MFLCFKNIILLLRIIKSKTMKNVEEFPLPKKQKKKMKNDKKK